MTQPMQSREQTRQRLIEAGIQLFGEQGFRGTTTRQLAQSANANIGSIAYHFGNKHGLYLAAASHIADALCERLNLPASAQPIPATVCAGPPTEQTIEQAHQMLLRLFQRMVRVFAEDPDCRRWMLLVVREQARPGEAFDILYDNAFGHIQQGVSALIAHITGLAEDSQRVILETHTLVGQTMFLLVGREALLRRLGLTHFDADTLAGIDSVIGRHLNQLRVPASTTPSAPNWLP